MEVMNRLPRILIVGTVFIFFLLIGSYILFPVAISNAYLDNEGHFYFTLMNKKYEAVDLIYKWHLDDPKAKLPVYSGTGKIKLNSRGSCEVVESFTPINDYDQRFYMMNIEVFDNKSKVGSYTKQKSPYDWDYSTSPPKNTHIPIVWVEK
jgi:hypothetical protein